MAGRREVTMRSKVSYKGHPIHSGLIPFPFAFLIGAFRRCSGEPLVRDALCAGRERSGWYCERGLSFGVAITPRLAVARGDRPGEARGPRSSK